MDSNGIPTVSPCILLPEEDGQSGRYRGVPTGGWRGTLLTTTSLQLVPTKGRVGEKNGEFGQESTTNGGVVGEYSMIERKLKQIARQIL